MLLINLPREVIDIIISYCNDDDKSAIAQVCKFFYKVLANDDIYIHFQNKKHFYKKALKKLPKHHTNKIKNYLNLNQGHDNYYVYNLLFKYQNIKILFIHEYYIYRQFRNNLDTTICASNIIRNMENLKHLYVYGSEKNFWNYYMIYDIKNIEILTLRNFYIDHSSLNSNIKILNLIDCKIMCAILNMNKIEKIYFSPNTIIGQLVIKGSENNNLELVMPKKLKPFIRIDENIKCVIREY